MRLDKDTILQLLRQQGLGGKVPEAERELPGEVDTDNERDRGLLERFGLDLGDLPNLLARLPGLADKLPEGVKDKLPGGLGKLL
jgi:hypothetical protein